LKIGLSTYFVTGLLCCIIEGSAQQINLKTYNVSDGLVNNAVRKIYQDSQGFLWICTWEGLSKYDGDRFQNFSVDNGLSHNLVNDVTENDHGGLFVATNDGTVDLITHNHIHREYFKNAVINTFYLTHQKKLLALTDDKGVFEIRGNTLQNLINPDTSAFYNSIEIGDSLFLFTRDRGPLTVYDHHFHIFSKSDFSNIATNCIYEDQSRRIWLGTDKGLRLLSAVKKNKLEYSELPHPFNSNILKENAVSAIFQDAEGTFWFGTDKGLVRILTDGKLQFITTRDGLPSDNISCIFQDREKNLWIGTYGGIAKVVTPAVSKILLDSSQVQGQVNFVHAINNHLLVFTSRGIFEGDIKGEIFRLLPLTNDIKNVIPVQHSEPLLICGKNNLYRYDTTLNQFRKIFHLNIQPYTAASYEGKIYFGTQDGLYMLSGNLLKKISFISYRIHSLLFDRQGFLWIGSWNNGLQRINFEPLEKDNGDQLEDFSKFVPDKNIRALFNDSKGNIWVGTRFHGASMLSETGPGKWSVKNFDHTQGLLSNWVPCFAENKDGDIWVSTLTGINKLVHKQEGYTIFNYSLITNFFCDIYSIAITGSGDLWCASDLGLITIKDEKLEAQNPLPVYITTVQLGTSGLNYADTTLPDEKPLELSFSRNYALFEFTAPGYRNEKALSYSYRLSGSGDSSWSVPSNNHSVQYASLQPGHYSFEVRMLGLNNAFGPVSHFSFVINTPFWRKGWFYLLLGIILLMIFYSVYRYRINQLLRLQKIRTRIATDLHDDIGSTLTNISILSELSKKNISQPGMAEQFLGRITEESISSQQALDDIIWSVNTNNDSLTATLARMRRFAAELFENSDISCTIDFEEIDHEVKLNMDQRRDVYLIFKECLNNIRKHSMAKNIHIKIGTVNSTLHIKVNDDGEGFDINASTDRNGLKNMQSRAEKWNGVLEVRSHLKQGTSVVCVLPIN